MTQVPESVFGRHQPGVPAQRPVWPVAGVTDFETQGFGLHCTASCGCIRWLV